MTGRVLWRESAMTWPSFRISLDLAPWSWWFRAWNDWDCTSSFTLWLGPLKVEWMANRPMFLLERAAPPPAAAAPPSDGGARHDAG